MWPAHRDARMVLILFLGFALYAIAGCSKGTKGDMRDMTREFNDMADLMSTIHDRASLDAAKPTLKKLLASRYERQEKFRKMSEDEQDRRKKEWETLIEEPDGKKYREATHRYAQEFARIVATPELGKHYMKEVVDEVAAKFGSRQGEDEIQ
jgi:hypothetical protein